MNLRNDPATFSPHIAAIGEPLLRSEDPKLLRGEGRYTDDLRLPGEAYCVMVRSRNGHGVIRAIKTDAARQMPGVLAVYTGADLSAYGLLKSSLPFKSRDGSDMRHTGRPALTRGATRPKPSRSTSMRCRR
jgi:carbon-monoxide dehydrogenase large subunit